MRLGIAEIHQEPIAKELGDVSLIALDDLGTGSLICTHHVTPVFRVELRGQLGGLDQVAKHHGQLATFSVWGMRFWCRDCHLGSRLLLWRTWHERLTGQGRTTGTAELEA